MVVQLGLATIPFGMRSSAAALTSGTTSGQSGSMRQAEELSMTMAPAAATLSPNCREADAPMENSATSTPRWSAVATSSTTTPSSVAPGRAGAGEEPQPVVGKAAGVEHGTHDRADLAGRAVHPDGQHLLALQLEGPVQRHHRLSRPGSARTTQVSRMDEVEIISMLMPSWARTSNMVADTPGWVFIPAPMIDTVAMSGSASDLAGADLRLQRPAHLGWRWPGRRAGR